MDYKEMGIKLSNMLINYNNINKESYNFILNKCLDELKVNNMDDRHIVTNAAIHELVVSKYDIVETKPFKLGKIEY